MLRSGQSGSCTVAVCAVTLRYRATHLSQVFIVTEAILSVSSCNDERTADQPLNCSAPVAGWPHAVTSDSIMQEPERKLSEPSVWEHPPDWQGVPSTLCKCTLSRTHSPSTVFQHLQWNSIRPPKDAAMRAFHSAHMDVSYVWCPESVKLVWMLEDSTLSLNHCKCTLLKLSQFQPRSFWQPGEVALWKRSQLLKGLALLTEENLISTGVQPKVTSTLFLM